MGWMADRRRESRVRSLPSAHDSNDRTPSSAAIPAAVRATKRLPIEQAGHLERQSQRRCPRSMSGLRSIFPPAGLSARIRAMSEYAPWSSWLVRL